MLKATPPVSAGVRIPPRFSILPQAGSAFSLPLVTAGEAPALQGDFPRQERSPSMGGSHEQETDTGKQSCLPDLFSVTSSADA